ncbi:MAG: exodeoxyribonuclease VII large subunit [Clostridiales bacterium]|jgi:exodeoxyribonuclease VII large subunit|nr:exodeoxyribonuclease VII large subunit [Clostridiales bacterium]
MRTAPVMLTVTQLNAYVKSLFDGDSHLHSVFLSGEISNFTNHYQSGHLYLSLKDEKCVVKAVMFASQASRLRFVPKDGMKVIVRGRVSVYEASGQYQLYIDDMQPDGLGALNVAFEQRKAKLAAEGLFNLERKKRLPPYPERIGIITSPTGAVIHDIRHVLERRYPAAEIIFAPVLVQGDGAAPQIVDAIEKMNRLRCADVLIVGRGGGSLEDLWAFNEESVARAVAASDIPIISAVGHETDVTICDFAADLRAPTPSAAAEMAVPNQEEVAALLNGYWYALHQSMEQKLRQCREALESAAHNRLLTHPEETISLRKMEVDSLSFRLTGQIQQMLAQQQTNLASLSGKLDALSPLKVLGRGYAMAWDENGCMITQAKQVAPGDGLRVQFAQGTVNCTVDAVEIPEPGGVQDE